MRLGPPSVRAGGTPPSAPCRSRRTGHNSARTLFISHNNYYF
nr:MAG TPA: hypothetical protein [Caudoviricetes sp.]